MILRHSILMYNIFEGHFDPLRLSKIGMAHPVIHVFVTEGALELQDTTDFIAGFLLEISNPQCSGVSMKYNKAGFV